MESDIVKKLRADILALEGVVPVRSAERWDTGLGIIAESFPLAAFPMGVHEFVSDSDAGAAATSGFITALMGKVTRPGGLVMWIGWGRKVFPPALSLYGIRPDRIIFVDCKQAKDLLWMIEQALKCDSLAAVVGEVKDLSLTESRRLQLAVEETRIPCFLHRSQPRHVHQNIASVCRWRIAPIPSHVPDELPGVGFPAWNVRLEKVRNGQPGSWSISWVDGEFEIGLKNSEANRLTTLEWPPEVLYQAL